MNKKRKIPDFQTYEEAARFFDEIDTTTLEFESEGWELFSSKSRGRSRTKSFHVPVEIDSAQFRRLARRARKMGTTPKKWLDKVVGDALKSVSDSMK